MLKRKKIFEDQISEEETDRNIELEQSQMTEYHRLKEKVATKSAKMLNEIHHYDREKNQDQETLNSLNRKRADIERALKGKETEVGFEHVFLQKKLEYFIAKIFFRNFRSSNICQRFPRTGNRYLRTEFCITFLVIDLALVPVPKNLW